MKDLSQVIQTFHKISNLNQKNFPERLTHTKGYGAYGTFTLTQNVSKYTKAKFLNSFDVTRIFVRFSNYKGERGFPDTLRDPRGMAIQFFTKDGRFDLTANSIPVFFIRDPALFVEFLQSQKRDPVTNLFNPELFWNFFCNHSQSLHAFLFYFSDRGIPKSFRHAHYYSCNALKFYTSYEEYFVKFHIKTLQGIQNLSLKEAEKLAGKNPDFYGEDLFYSIQEGNFPKWKIYFQVISKEDIKNFSFDPFDVTKVWSQKEFPLQELGILELNENPKDYLEEVEKKTFSPNNLVDGIALSPDPILQMRALVYSDAQRHRLGNLYNEVSNLANQEKLQVYTNGYLKNLTYSSEYENDYTQARKFLDILNETEKESLALAISQSLVQTSNTIQKKVIQVFETFDFGLYEKIQRKLLQLKT